MAVNLSDLFAYEDLERKESDQDGLEMRRLSHTGPPGAADGEAVTETQFSPLDYDRPAAENTRGGERVDDVSAGQQAEMSNAEGEDGVGPTDAAVVVDSRDRAEGVAQHGAEEQTGIARSPAPAPPAAETALETERGPNLGPSGEDAVVDERGADSVAEASGAPSVDASTK